MALPSPNAGKNLLVRIDDVEYARYPIGTSLVTPENKDPVAFAREHASSFLEPGDILFIGEKIISIMQGRAYRIDGIKPSKAAFFLSRFVWKNPGGIGLAMPETMQLAIEEVGLWRISLAALIGGFAKLVGIKGVFYMIAGDQARAVDGPVPYAIPPYNNFASKGPLHPRKVAEDISKELGVPAAIVDANDLGVRILGHSKGVDAHVLARALQDNPLGQGSESTPIGILRKI